jgi:hypothetical protein
MKNLRFDKSYNQLVYNDMHFKKLMYMKISTLGKALAARSSCRQGFNCDLDGLKSILRDPLVDPYVKILAEYILIYRVYTTRIYTIDETDELLDRFLTDKHYPDKS